MSRAPLLLASALALCACGGSPILEPLVATPDDAIPRTPPSTSVAPAVVPWPDVRTRTLHNGVTFVAVPMPSATGAVVLARTLDAGESGPADTFGLPSFTIMMMRRGSLGATGAVEWPLYDTGAESFYGWDTEFTEIRGLAHEVDVVPVVFAVGRELRYPAFEPRSLEFELRDYIEASRAADTPSRRGRNALARALFGADSPLALGGRGDEAHIARIGVADLDQYHRNHYVPERTVVVVAGRFDERIVNAAVDSAFGDWAARDASRPARFEPRFAETIPPYQIVDEPRDHAIIQLAVPFEVESVEERAALRVLSLLYGEVFDSFTNLALRERDGDTYSASNWTLGASHRGALVTEIVVDIDRVAAVLAVLRQAAAKLVSGDVDARDLELARAQLTARYLEALSQPLRTAELTAMLAQRLTPSDVSFASLATEHDAARRALPAAYPPLAARIFRPAGMTVVVTGPRARLESAVREGWGDPGRR